MVWSSPELSEDTDHESIELTSWSSSGEEDELFKYKSPNVKINHKSKPSLFLALCRTYIVTFVTAGFLKLIHDLLNFVGPQVLKLEIAFLSSRKISLQSPSQVADRVCKEP